MSDLSKRLWDFLQGENERLYGPLIADAKARQAAEDRERCEALEAEFEDGGDCA